MGVLGSIVGSCRKILLLLIVLMISAVLVQAAESFKLSVGSDRDEYLVGMGATFTVSLTDKNGKAVNLNNRYLYATYGSTELTEITLQKISNTAWAYTPALVQSGSYKLNVYLMRDNKKQIQNIESTIASLQKQITKINSEIAKYTDKLNSTKNFFKKIAYKAAIAVLKIELSVTTSLINVLNTTITNISKPLASSSKSITVLQPPKPSITSPASGSWHNGNISVKGNSGWSKGGKAILYIDNTVLSSTNFVAGADDFNFTVNTSEIADGVHKIKLEIIPDGYELKYSAEITANVDQTKPEFKNANPVHLSLTNQSPEIISIELADGGSGINSQTVSFKVDDTAVAVTYADGLIKYTPANLTDGNHIVKVSAADNAGTSSDAEWSFTVDTTKPTVAITTPSNGLCTSQTTQNITATVADETSGVNVASIKMRVDGQDIAATYAEGIISAAIDNLTDAQHTISISVNDNAGNESTAESTFTVDTTKPEIVVSSPVADSYSNQTSQTISAKITDALSGVKDGSIALLVDNAAVETTFADNTVTANLQNLAEGQHAVKLSVNDNAGNAASAEWKFTVDSTKPTIEVSIPAVDSYSNASNQTISVKVADVLSGINAESIVLKVDDVAVAATYADDVVTASVQNLTDAAHKISLNVSDKAGNTSTSEWSFTVDTVKPLISDVSINNGDELTVIPETVSAKITDATSGIASATITLDGNNTNATIADNIISFTPAADLAAGDHILLITVTDKAGNVTTQEIAFVYNSLVETSVTVKREGAAVAGIDVSACDSAGDVLATATTGENGIAVFNLTKSIKVVYKVTENGSEFASAEITVPNAAEISLPATSSITVTYNGTPLSSISVSAKDEAGNIVATQQTNENGIATFSVSGKIKLFCNSNGYTFETELLDAPVSHTVDLAGSYSTIEVYKSNQLCSGVSVSAVDTEGNVISTLDRLSFGKGSFLIESGKEFCFVVTENGAEFKTANLTAPATAELDIPEYSTVTVANAKGAPLSNVTVSLVQNANYTRTTDDSGIVTFSVAEKQTVQFKAIVDGTTYLSEEKQTPDSFVILCGAGGDDDTDTLAPVVYSVTPLANKQIEGARTNVSANYTDIGSGVDTDSISITLDGANITTSCTVTNSSFTYAPAEDMTAGWHTVILNVSDNEGNATQKEWGFELRYALKFGNNDGVVLDYPFDLGGKGTIVDLFGENFSKDMVVTVGGKQIDIIYKDSTKVYLKIPEITNPVGSIYQSQKVLIYPWRNSEPVELPVEIETLDPFKVTVGGDKLVEGDIVNVNENPSVNIFVEGGKAPYTASAVVYHGDTSQTIEFNKEEGFAAEIPLVEGGNQIVFTAKDDFGNIVIKRYWANKDTVAPAIPAMDYMQIDGEAGDSVKLYWKVASDVDKYILQVAGCEDQKLEISSDPVQTKIISGLTAGESKEVKIYAVDKAGNESELQTIAVTPYPFFDLFEYQKKISKYRVSFLLGNQRWDKLSSNINSFFPSCLIPEDSVKHSIYENYDEYGIYGNYKKITWEPTKYTNDSGDAYCSRECFEDIKSNSAKMTLWSNASGLKLKQKLSMKSPYPPDGTSYAQVISEQEELYNSCGIYEFSEEELEYFTPYWDSYGASFGLYAWIINNNPFYSMSAESCDIELENIVTVPTDSRYEELFLLEYGTASQGEECTIKFDFGGFIAPPQIAPSNECGDAYSWAFSKHGRFVLGLYGKYKKRDLENTDSILYGSSQEVISSCGEITSVNITVVYKASGWGADDGVRQTWESYTDANNNGKYDEGEAFSDTGKQNGKYDFGEEFTDAGNGIYDEGEKYSDSNDNGKHDEGEWFEDVGNGVYDEGEDFVDEDAVFCYIPTPIECDQDGAHVSNFDGPKFMANKPGIYTVKGKYGGEITVEVVNQPVDLIVTGSGGYELTEFEEEDPGLFLFVNNMPISPDALDDPADADTEDKKYATLKVKVDPIIDDTESVTLSIPQGINLYKGGKEISNLIFGSYVSGYDDEDNAIVETVDKIAEENFTVDSIQEETFYIEATSIVNSGISVSVNGHSDSCILSIVDSSLDIVGLYAKGSHEEIQYAVLDNTIYFMPIPDKDTHIFTALTKRVLNRAGDIIWDDNDTGTLKSSSSKGVNGWEKDGFLISGKTVDGYCGVYKGSWDKNNLLISVESKYKDKYSKQLDQKTYVYNLVPVKFKFVFGGKSVDITDKEKLREFIPGGDGKITCDDEGNIKPQELAITLEGIDPNDIDPQASLGTFEKKSDPDCYVSNYQGFCLNGIFDEKITLFPGESESIKNNNDFTFDGGSKDGKYNRTMGFFDTSGSNAKLKFYCKDYGGKFSMYIVVNLKNNKGKFSKYLKLPIDDDDDGIADVWEDKYRSNNTLDPKIDNEQINEPFGRGVTSKGDGFSAIDEYRGFYIEGNKHIRTDPCDRQDIFFVYKEEFKRTLSYCLKTHFEPVFPMDFHQVNKDFINYKAETFNSGKYKLPEVEIYPIINSEDRKHQKAVDLYCTNDTNSSGEALNESSLNEEDPLVNSPLTYAYKINVGGWVIPTYLTSNKQWSYTSVLSHEIGHFFDLDHYIDTSRIPEYKRKSLNYRLGDSTCLVEDDCKAYQKYIMYEYSNKYGDNKRFTIKKDVSSTSSKSDFQLYRLH